MSDEAGSTTYTYDTRGRLTSAGRSQSNAVYALQYAYTDQGQVTNLTYPDSTYDSTAYNARGLPTSLTAPGATYVSGATPFIPWGGRRASPLATAARATLAMIWPRPS